MPDSSAYHRLIATWNGAGEHLLEPALTKSDVVEMFAEHGFRPSRDALELYTRVGGMPLGYTDDRMFELWSRERIHLENDTAWNYLWIGDWLVMSHLYAIQPVDDQHSAVYIDHQGDRVSVPELVAGSLYEFADLLVDNPSAVGIML